MAGVSKAVIFGMGIAKQWDDTMAEPPSDYYFLNQFPTHYFDGDSLDDWVALIERHPDRFLIGTDKVGHWSTYPAEAVKYYTLLDKLRPATVDKICRENALALIKKY